MPTIAICPSCSSWVLLKEKKEEKKALFFFCPVCAVRVEARASYPAPSPRDPEVDTWIPVRLEKVRNEAP